MKTSRSRWYPFQVSFTSENLDSKLPMKVYCSWALNWLRFRLKQDHREFSKVPRKLGVLRWKFLDVRTRRSTSSKFGRSFRGIFRRISGELGVEVGINLFVSSSATTFLFVSLNFVEYWRSYERLKFTQFPTSFSVFSRTSQLWGYFPAISGNHWASK